MDRKKILTELVGIATDYLSSIDSEKLSNEERGTVSSLIAVAPLCGGDTSVECMQMLLKTVEDENVPKAVVEAIKNIADRVIPAETSSDVLNYFEKVEDVATGILAEWVLRGKISRMRAAIILETIHIANERYECNNFLKAIKYAKEDLKKFSKVHGSFGGAEEEMYKWLKKLKKSIKKELANN